MEQKKEVDIMEAYPGGKVGTVGTSVKEAYSYAKSIPDLRTNFELVSKMNEAFGNKKGDPTNIDWPRVRNQSKNMLDELGELFIALGANKSRILSAVQNFKSQLVFDSDVNPEQVRDANCDIHVFGYGNHHFMGIDADRDMQSVIEGVMTRFIKDPDDKIASIQKHAANGVTDVAFEGEYPTMVMRSISDQPDAPKGKFLKSASFREPVFYDAVAEVEQDREELNNAINENDSE
jgi:hypothetical protein